MRHVMMQAGRLLVLERIDGLPATASAVPLISELVRRVRRSFDPQDHSVFTHDIELPFERLVDPVKAGEAVRFGSDGHGLDLEVEPVAKLRPIVELPKHVPSGHFIDDQVASQVVDQVEGFLSVFDCRIADAVGIVVTDDGNVILRVFEKFR